MQLTRDDLIGRVKQIQALQDEYQQRLQQARQEARDAEQNLLLLSGALQDCGFWQQKLDATEQQAAQQAEADRAKAEQERQGRRRKRQGDAPEAEEPPMIAGRIGPADTAPVTA